MNIIEKQSNNFWNSLIHTDEYDCYNSSRVSGLPIITVMNIREEFLRQKRLHDIESAVVDKSGSLMLEILNANFLANEAAIFGTPNVDYINYELAWYKSKSLNVNDIPGGPPTVWKQVSDKDGYINSNYGWCIWSSENGNQYENAKAELKANPWSRRAIMIYTRPNMWIDYNVNGRNDFMCTNNVQYLIRDGYLHAIVNMRSNDVIFGYKNDWAWQKEVLMSLARDLNMLAGNILWNAGSLHVYAKHFHLVK